MACGSGGVSMCYAPVYTNCVSGPVPPLFCPPKVIMSYFAKVKMSYFELQCPTVIGGHDGGRGQDHNESKGSEPASRYSAGDRKGDNAISGSSNTWSNRSA